jgi:hypothetical protein
MAVNTSLDQVVVLCSILTRPLSSETLFFLNEYQQVSETKIDRIKLAQNQESVYGTGHEKHLNSKAVGAGR